eukprot:7108187-Pyramimonas_sp.AAC.1
MSGGADQPTRCPPPPQGGYNFDLVTGCGLNDESRLGAVERCVRQRRPQVAIMVPACQPFCRWATFNYK